MANKMMRGLSTPVLSEPFVSGSATQLSTAYTLGFFLHTHDFVQSGVVRGMRKAVGERLGRRVKDVYPTGVFMMLRTTR